MEKQETVTPQTYLSEKQTMRIKLCNKFLQFKDGQLVLDDVKQIEELEYLRATTSMGVYVKKLDKAATEAFVRAQIAKQTSDMVIKGGTTAGHISNLASHFKQNPQQGVIDELPPETVKQLADEGLALTEETLVEDPNAKIAPVALKL